MPGHFVRNHRFALAALAIVLLARIGFEVWARAIVAAPVDAPIALSSRGAVDQRIRIPVPDRYALMLSFRADRPDRDRLRELLGESSYSMQGEPIPDGVRIPVRWSLSEAGSGRVVARGDDETFGTSSWSSDAIDRNVNHLSAAPGSYRLQARITRDLPELAGVSARLAMRLNAKASGSWQTEWVWTGRLACALLVDPVLALLSAWLLWRVFARLRARRRAAQT